MFKPIADGPRSPTTFRGRRIRNPTILHAPLRSHSHLIERSFDGRAHRMPVPAFTSALPWSVNAIRQPGPASLAVLSSSCRSRNCVSRRQQSTRSLLPMRDDGSRHGTRVVRRQHTPAPAIGRERLTQGTRLWQMPRLPRFKGGEQQVADVGGDPQERLARGAGVHCRGEVGCAQHSVVGLGGFFRIRRPHCARQPCRMS